MTITAIVPLKALADAKGRLSPALDPADRRAVVEWMARQVLEACEASPAIDETLVIAGDRDAATVARDAGARSEVVDGRGLGAALAAADVLTAHLPATLVLAADLPQITVEDIQTVVDAAEPVRGPAVVVAPARDGGTGALLRRPPGVIPPAFGPSSAAAHARLAAAAGVRLLEVHRPGLANDVDTPQQLRAVLASSGRLDVGSLRR